MAARRFETEHVDVSPLAQPLTFEFSGKTAKNRFLKAAMSERMSSWDPKDLAKRGIPTKELVNMYKRWGEGGFGIVLIGNTMVEYDQLQGAGNPIISLDNQFSGERFEAFQDLAAASKIHGSLAIVQLSHPGRQVPENIQPHPISASDVQLHRRVLDHGYGKPRPMEKEDFDRVIASFAHAAEYCYKAGFDGVQLHSAHGYLLAQFLAPSTNNRTDQYGGSLTNRARLIFEITEAIRARVPDKIFSLSIKINSVEFQDGGFSTEDCKTLCAELDHHGFDFVELSGGTYESTGFKHHRESTMKREAFFLEFAESVIPELKKAKAYITGGLRTAPAMVTALETVHGVGIGRPAAHEFDIAQKILDGKVASAVHHLLDEQDFPMTAAAAGTQMYLVGNDNEPLDFSRQEHLSVFQKCMRSHIEELAHNPDNSKFGPAKIDGMKLEPYGTAYVVA